MPQICPECGAVLDEGTSCQSMFDQFLVLEFTDAGYGEVHMLTVACFMIQHGRYSNAGLVWIEKQLRANLEEGISVEHVRREAGKEADQGKRGWKVTRQPGTRPLPKIAWSMTIADVAKQYKDAESYRELVRQWARVTVREMKALLPAGPNPPTPLP